MPLFPGAIPGIPGLSHNMIHRILEERDMTHRAGRCARRVPWARHGRDHSDSLSHTDWMLLLDGRWLIARGGDASRPIMGCGIFGRATSASAVEALRRVIAAYGKPASVITGHGSQPCATGVRSRLRGPAEFERFLVAGEMRHVLSGVDHPQTNGKVERFFGEAGGSISLSRRVIVQLLCE